MDYGYMGKMLSVDLNSRTWSAEAMEYENLRQVVGGRGLGIFLLLKEGCAHVDPFAEENPLIFSTGPYTGTGVFSAFYNLTTKSPLTGLAASCHSGGTWGPSLKKAGYDAVIIRGKSRRPCYLLITETSCDFLDAEEIWGKRVRDTTNCLEGRHGKAGVAVIGPAGENLVRYACVMNDTHRAAGRGGAGAVMGSKGLKAIVVKGKKDIRYMDREAFAGISRQVAKKAMENGKFYGIYGTSIGVSVLNQKGVLPSYNFRSGRFERADEIGAEELKSRYWVRDKGCFHCPLKCANVTSVPDGPYAVKESEGPEYETLVALGSNCGNGDLASIIKANDLCNDLGLDTISAGNTIALVMDLHSKGLIDKEFTDGLDLSWGNAPAIVGLIEKIGRRKGCGDILAEGSLQTARSLGKGCEKSVVHAKGQEFPGFEIRRTNVAGLSFATSNRGACHLRSCVYVEELSKQYDFGFSEAKLDLLVEKENRLALVDSLIMCKFGQRFGEVTVDLTCEILRHLTGMEFTARDLQKVGERIYNLERLFNLTTGEDCEAVLPDRFFSEDLSDKLENGKRLSREDFNRALSHYYRAREWSEQGVPLEEKRAELGI